MTAPKKAAARAVADVTEGLILATVDIRAAPERVFRAVTDGAEIVQWWGSDEVYRTRKWTSDLRVGGKWRADGEGADGVAFHVEGEFLELDPPRKVVHTWKAPFDGDNVTTVSYTFEAIAEGTRVTLRHSGFGDRAESCRNHTSGWELVLNWLASFAEPKAEAEAPLPVFFCRLVPPRTTFVMDMTAEERAMMGQHAAYWAEHMKAGRVIVYGPVGDPAGPWGLGVLRMKDAAALKAFQDGDPAIRSGFGFSYVTMPMIQAIY